MGSEAEKVRRVLMCWLAVGSEAKEVERVVMCSFGAWFFKSRK